VLAKTLKSIYKSTEDHKRKSTEEKPEYRLSCEISTDGYSVEQSFIEKHTQDGTKKQESCDRVNNAYANEGFPDPGFHQSTS
jgi:hypothetical protein